MSNEIKYRFLQGKTKLVALLFLLSVSAGLHAQSGWVSQSAGTSDYLPSVYFINANTGWAVSFYEKIFKTTNGGANWTQTNLSLTTNEQAVFFIDALTGWLGGYNGKIAKSTDGGLSWNLQVGQTNLGIHSIKFINANTGFAAGDGGQVLKTTNGGTNWTGIYNVNGSSFLGMDVLNKDTVYICGANSVIYSTTNSGTNWTLQNSGGPYLNSIKFVNALTGFAVGAGSDKKTTNGGLNWVNMDGGLGGVFYNSVYFYNSQTGWVTGNNIIKCTANGGASWFTEDSIALGNDYTSIFFANNLTGWACGLRGLMRKTTSAGAVPPAAPTNLNAGAVSSTKISLNWVDNSSFEFYFKIERSLNNSTFTLIDSVSPNSAVYTDSSLAPNTGYFYRVYASNIGGNSGYTNTAYAVTFPGPPGTTTLLFPANNAADVNLTPFILWNNVSGASAYQIQLSTDSLFASFLVNDSSISNTIYPVSNGTLNYNTKYYWRVRAKNNIGTGPWSALWNFRTINLTGVSLTQNEIPKVFKMYSNYPNPFNPSTKISFDLPQASFTKIVIYDITGRQVAELVNEKLSAGKYSINWNALQYSSGVYFYKITAGDFIDVKKMILVK